MVRTCRISEEEVSNALDVAVRNHARGRLRRRIFILMEAMVVSLMRRLVAEKGQSEMSMAIERLYAQWRGMWFAIVEKGEEEGILDGVGGLERLRAEEIVVPEGVREKYAMAYIHC